MFSYRALKIVISLSVLFIFAGAVLYWENRTERLHIQTLEEHAQIISNAVWRLDNDVLEEYLYLAARTNRYASIRVYTELNEKPFIEITGPELPRFDRLLLSLKLEHYRLLSAPIIWNAQEIGRIEVNHYHGTVSIYLYWLLMAILLLAAILFFIQTLEAKQDLARLVEERTAHLNLYREYLSSIIDSMPSLIIGINSDLKVTLWNKTAEAVTGITPEQAQGKSVGDVFPHLRLDETDLRNSMEMNRVAFFHKRPRRVNGEMIVEDLTIFPLSGREVRGAVVRVDDLTEKYQMEEILIQNEKMLSIGGLAAGMAHEINNPLAGMTQTANVLANRLWRKKDMPANIKAAEEWGLDLGNLGKYMEAREIPKMVESLEDSGKRIAEIVSNMLSFARQASSGKSTQDMRELMDRTLALAATDYDLKKQHDFRNIVIEKEYCDEPLPVLCEAGKIQQVILNILRNGAQAMQDVRGREHRFIIRIRPDDGGKMVRIEIEDNGPGISEEIKKRIFEPFFTTKPEGVGTGLGLSVSYYIITENHNGEMFVLSEAGHGANFVLRLPRETE